MTKTELRALATELLATLDRYQHLLDKIWHPDHPDAVEREKELTAGSYLINRAKAALATPPPEPPTDEELLRTYGKAKRDHCYEGDLDDWPKKAERAATIAGLRAALERWGR